MPTDKSQAEAFQDDIHALLEVLGLGNHARSKSPHQVLHQEVIPAIKRLKGQGESNSTSSPVAGSYTALQWREEPPTKEGTYWFDHPTLKAKKPAEVHCPDVDGLICEVQVACESAFLFWEGADNHLQARFAGPIAEPVGEAKRAV